MDNDEKKIAVPNTVGELIDFLKQFPENAVLNIYIKLKDITTEVNQMFEVCHMSTLKILPM